MDANALLPCLKKRDEKTFFLKVYVQPRASRTRLIGMHGEALKIFITASPVEGKANKEILTFFAKFFRIPKKMISLKSGEQSRSKTLLVEKVPIATAQQILTESLAK